MHFQPSLGMPAVCSDSFQKKEMWPVCGICESSYLFTVYSCITLKSYFRKIRNHKATLKSATSLLRQLSWDNGVREVRI